MTQRLVSTGSTSDASRGQIIAQASRNRDEVVVANLDLDEIREVRGTWQFYRDRRPDAYGELTAP